MKKIWLTAFLIASIQMVDAQVYYEEKDSQNAESTDEKSLKDRMYFGGNFSFSISRNFTYIDVSPLAGYMVTNDFSVGLGATYMYLSREYELYPSGNTFKVNSSVYGGRTFLRHNVFENYFAHLEFEALNVNVLQAPDYNYTDQEWVPSLFIGAGVFQPIFGRGGINITVLYNLLYDDIKSPYNSPLVIRGGFTL